MLSKYQEMANQTGKYIYLATFWNIMGELTDFVIESKYVLTEKEIQNKITRRFKFWRKISTVFMWKPQIQECEYYIGE